MKDEINLAGKWCIDRAEQIMKDICANRHGGDAQSKAANAGHTSKDVVDRLMKYATS